MHKLIFIFLGILLVLSAIAAIGSYSVFIRTSKRRSTDGSKVKTEKYGVHKERMDTGLKHFESIEKEAATVTSFDGLKLFSSVILPESTPKGVIIAFHGYRSSHTADFGLITPELLKAGYAVILADQRSHGRSEGKYIAFGVLERFDVKTWCEYAEKRFGKDMNIFLYGISMGAATVVMSTEVGLPKSVKAVIADCGFSSPKDILVHNLPNKYKIPPYPTIFLVDLFARILGHFSYFKASSLESAKKSEIPILFIHGADDRFVPTEMSTKIHHDAIKEGRSHSIIIFEDTKHARSYINHSERYLSDFLSFVDSKK